ncbi:MAG: MmgE/PrpD family protein [Firmicutes bacterium]|nr:MmgE/PrpD family protein [Bacillota bacterium]
MTVFGFFYTCFAVGETLASSGKDLMTAYILGYEVSLKIADALMPELTGRGWHGTPVFGTIGAAVCAGKIMKLPKEVLVNAIGIAATMASGLMENFGTNVKPFHAGIGSFQRNQGCEASESRINRITSGTGGKMRLREALFGKIHNRKCNTVWG